MLKEENIEKKRLDGLNYPMKRTTQVSDDNNTPMKISKTYYENDENKVYELPVVCIFNF